MKVLDFNLIFNSTYKFMEPFARLIKLDDRKFHLAQYVLELSLFDMKFCKYKPSMIASASIYLINKIRKAVDVWPDILVAASGYEEK